MRGEKGRGGERRGEKGRGEEGREGTCPLDYCRK